ncbi:protein of unknown function DUF1501 [Planctopirus limnophila DSM 3776]|uniref:Sulfatase n=1 Tax=Planctopirus limnophila (strain ATCC 43296 / DSM 3776 / IFAM 1008 / Mu 290) TaxID=521674 RepID=D5SWN6_PLAL2|nr:DUF1501 domain-containing protein [Planctopirus limnophila]ADG69629.1 protein of unknown function DUF1501 [Planctopirus limnophila DSM 3776]
MYDQIAARFSRRTVLSSLAGSLAGLTLGTGLSRWAGANSEVQNAASVVGEPHFPPRAKRVIFLFMHGGVSQVDTFDYKPELSKLDGKTLPFQAAANIDAKPVLMQSPWKFNQYGESGAWCSELFPHIVQQIDRLCIIKSMHSRGQSHGQAVSMLHTGSDNLVRPSVGAWVSYGLGCENENLPAFVSIGPSAGHGGPRNYGAAFLPAIHQATTIGRQGRLGNGQIDFLSQATPEQLELVRAIQKISQKHLDRVGPDPQLQGAIETYDLAYRMQAAAPDVLDLSHETEATKVAYGIGEKATDEFGRQCLLARRLVESGIRYVELSTGNVWDQHGGLRAGHAKNSMAVDQPIAALLNDLDQRGLLDETLVVWAGEFGRTPIVQGNDGRDHNPQGFTVWLAGGGVRSGFSYGETDEVGYFAAQDRVHMHDLHATMLHLLGIDHERLTYKYAGRDFRLTDVHGRVVKEILV